MQSLQSYHTFQLSAFANAIIEINSFEQLKVLSVAWQQNQVPRLFLGEGSNTIFTQDFLGEVWVNRLKGTPEIQEDGQGFLIRAAAGMSWHEFVVWTLDQQMPGLENLALIPGTVGASPIQNIGAYGAEVANFIHGVVVFDCQTLQDRYFDQAQCQFAYRDSVFKQLEANRYFITAVDFYLPKAWHGNIAYKDIALELAKSHIVNASAQDIFDAVVAVRSRKLPDPKVLGNAGSFFKNPIVDASQFTLLKTQFPNLVSYPQADGSVKLAAAWLIDACGWKGKSLGGAGVHDQQALVLVNRYQATGQEVLALSQAIVQSVQKTFGVTLECEPLIC